MSVNNFMLKFLEIFIDDIFIRRKTHNDFLELNSEHKNILLTYSSVEELEKIIKEKNLPYKIVYFDSETKVSRVWDGILDIDTIHQKQEDFGDEEQDFADIIGYGANEYRFHVHLSAGTDLRDDIMLNRYFDWCEVTSHNEKYVIKYEVGILLNPLSEKDRIRDMVRRKKKRAMK